MLNPSIGKWIVNKCTTQRTHHRYHLRDVQARHQGPLEGGGRRKGRPRELGLLSMSIGGGTTPVDEVGKGKTGEDKIKEVGGEQPLVHA